MKKLTAKLIAFLTISFFIGLPNKANAFTYNNEGIKIEKTYISQEKSLQADTWISFTPQETGSYIINVDTTEGRNITLWNFNKSKELEKARNNEKNIARTLIGGQKYYLKIERSKFMSLLGGYNIVQIKKLKTPIDEYFSAQWGLFNTYNGIDINILPAWEYSKGRHVKVGIMDTGTDYTHSDLLGNQGLEVGYNFVHSMSDVFPMNETYNSFAAAVGHGTMIAGIIGANTNNVKGISGIAPEAEVIPLKILGEPIENYSKYDDTVATFVNAIQYAKEQGVKIINCSFGGSVPDITEREAMEAVEDDILFVVAAGNKGNDLMQVPIYPACYGLEHVIVVGAVDCNGQLIETSNYGGPTDVVAPGDEIISTYPGNQYMYSTGTSMAAAFVSGVGALAWSNNLDLTPQEVRRILISNENVTLLDIDKDKVMSRGMINAYKAVAASKQIPVKDEIYDRKVCAENTKGMINYYKEKVDDSEKTNTIIVKFNRQTYNKQWIQEMKKLHSFSQLEVRKYLELIDAYVIELESIEEADRAVDILNKERHIVYAEPNYVRR